MTIDDLLNKWRGTEGGAERANYQMFLTELAQALGVPAPDPKGAGLGDYQFEAPVKSLAALGKKGTGRIDLYKRDCFILEAKQSRMKPGDAPELELPEPPPQPIYDLFGEITGYQEPAGRKLGRYDTLMADARIQAERYALALPADHRSPPFLIVADIGRSFELYFDWAGNGRGYGPFPNEQSYRVALTDLAKPDRIATLGISAADMLRAIWTDPAGIDPRLRAAEVTRDVSTRLSRVASHLEKSQRLERPDATDAVLSLGIESTSLFVMRLLFCMFAEDVGLLPKGRFVALLRDARDLAQSEDTAKHFWRASLTELWGLMAQPGSDRPYWTLGKDFVRYFNGNLFTDRKVYDLDGEFINELVVAAEREWANVEPAIFGTLLEQVLTADDRAKLGAHYTPRAYVERLVDATMMEVLRPEWNAALAAARTLVDGGDRDGGIAVARDFHSRLTRITVLDPACGTGNFLYVAMEQLLRLEGEVRQFAAGLDADIAPAIHPNQFLGLELNPRAAVIAELVLWIGWLRFRLANTPGAIGDPVLPTLNNINFGTHGGYDAVLARTATGDPDVASPRRPAWPEADFIIGNPPFIGGQDIRERLGSDYAEALWTANPRVPRSADFVMQWWDRAADILTRPGTRLRRFGFVTTNSITQVFSRRVIEHWLHPAPAQEAPGHRGDADHAGAAAPAPQPPSARDGGKLHLVLAIPDHPWTRVTKDAAAVRIAMTVAAPGPGRGQLMRIMGERALDTDAPELDEATEAGTVNANLTLGTNVGHATKLRANEGICHDGVKLHGKGFSVKASDFGRLGVGRREGLEDHVRPYRNGKDLTGRTESEIREKMVIDLFGLTEAEVMDRFPEVYQHVLKEVKPDRNKNNRDSYRQNWWIFGEPRRELRPALADLQRYIATVDTSKHRIFQFVDSMTICDDGVVIVADDRYQTLGVLSSWLHVCWALEAGGTLEDRPRYFKSLIFDPFPFPDPSPAVGDIAERLDTTRRAALAENPKLTMTGLYNLVEEVRAGTPLTPAREAEVVKARARIIAKLHDDLDQAVADAYGWGDEWRRAPLPPGEIVARLVALNAERAGEEAAGHVRWLRPYYQRPRFGG
ncbi:DNA methyltransferase [Sphingomonas sp.]|uniref:class I SAM-dependent DNA methyltransferase n=1 Tax=Sphingomonas sp. TaxID=28214 RepID=UPI001D6CFBD3|nr:DNA methyltransferase [Sphingomonas sp.]MBX9797808.1 class I SAM-dependent DNA methyltransferase [Sphingomonas sp.]